MEKRKQIEKIGILMRCKMFVPNTIEGIDVIQKNIPNELQYWHKFWTYN